jgi:hypothetical protein
MNSLERRQPAEKEILSNLRILVIDNTPYPRSTYMLLRAKIKEVRHLTQPPSNLKRLLENFDALIIHYTEPKFEQIIIRALKSGKPVIIVERSSGGIPDDLKESYERLKKINSIHWILKDLHFVKEAVDLLTTIFTT